MHANDDADTIHCFKIRQHKTVHNNLDAEFTEKDLEGFDRERELCK